MKNTPLEITNGLFNHMGQRGGPAVCGGVCQSPGASPAGVLLKNSMQIILIKRASCPSVCASVNHPGVAGR